MRALACLLFVLGSGGLLACTELPEIRTGECGNQLVELAAEDCDGPTTSGTCGRPGEAGACRFVCDPASTAARGGCPADFSCGRDSVCRQSSGALALVGSPLQVSASKLVAGDVDGDRRADLLALAQPPEFGPSSARLVYFGDGAQAAAIAAVPGQLGPSTEVALPDATSAIVSLGKNGLAVLVGQRDRTLLSQNYSSFPLPSVIQSVQGVALDAIPPGGFDYNSALGDELLLAVKLVLPGAPVRSFFGHSDGTGIAELVDMPGSVDQLLGGLSAGHLLWPKGPEHFCPSLPLAFQDTATISLLTPCALRDGSWGWTDAQSSPYTTISLGQNIASGPPVIADVNRDGLPDLLILVKPSDPNAYSTELHVAYGTGLGYLTPRPGSNLQNVTEPLRLPVPKPGQIADTPPLYASEIPLAVGHFDQDNLLDFVFPSYILTSSNPLGLPTSTGPVPEPGIPGGEGGEPAGAGGSSGGSGQPGAGGQPGEGGPSGGSGQAGAGGSSGGSGQAGAAGSSGGSGQAGAAGSSGGSGQAGEAPWEAQAYSFLPFNSSNWVEVRVCDLNADGRSDLVAVSEDASSLDVLLGDGAGLFSLSRVGLNGVPGALQIGDFDGDLVDDVVFRERGYDSSQAIDDTLAVLFGARQGVPSEVVRMGSFGEILSSAPGRRLDTTALDLARDLVLFSRRNKQLEVSQFYGASDRRLRTSFSLQHLEDVSGKPILQNDLPEAVTATRFTAQGTAGLAVLTLQQPSSSDSGASPIKGSSMRLWRVDVGADASFSAAGSFVLGESYFFDGLLVSGDIDGDNVDEVMVLSAPTGQADDPPNARGIARVFRATGSSTPFEQTSSQGFSVSVSRQSEARLVDLDADGLPELVLLEGSFGPIYATGVDSPTNSDGSAPTRPSDMEASSSLWIISQKSKGVFDWENPRQVQLPQSARASSFCVLGGRDGSVARLAVSTESQVYLVERKAGQEQISSLPDGDVDGDAVACADFDGDGVDDLAVSVSSALRVFRGVPRLP